MEGADVGWRMARPDDPGHPRRRRSDAGSQCSNVAAVVNFPFRATLTADGPLPWGVEPDAVVLDLAVPNRLDDVMRAVVVKLLLDGETVCLFMRSEEWLCAALADLQLELRPAAGCA
jgi:hypothetical protein